MPGLSGAGEVEGEEVFEALVVGEIGGQPAGGDGGGILIIRQKFK
jgi:hypothetical protein